MAQIGTLSRSRLPDFLKRATTHHLVEVGRQLATQGSVCEINRLDHMVSGVVRDESDLMHTTKLFFASGNEVTAQCTCCSIEQMQESWCAHAVALLLRSAELDFLVQGGGFAPSEATFRAFNQTPKEVARMLSEVALYPRHEATTPQEVPQVIVKLDTTSDRLGVQLLFNGEIQEPVVFEGFRPLSPRTLDNLFLQLLDEKGTWDEEEKLWFISWSSDIDLILGLIKEFPQPITRDSGQPLQISTDHLTAKAYLEWTADSTAPEALNIRLKWFYPSKEEIEAKYLSEGVPVLLGTGPYWTMIGTTLYRVAPAAAKLASLFPRSPVLSLARSQIAPLLESLQVENPHLVVVNPEDQPVSREAEPLPSLEITSRLNTYDHFSQAAPLEIYTFLDFDYPQPQPGENIVYLPNRSAEQEYVNHLLSKGFTTQDKKKFTLTGDNALDLAYTGTSFFPEGWKVKGLDLVQKSIKFADLSLNLSLIAQEEKAHRKVKSEAEEEEKPFTSTIDWFDCQVSLTQNNANVPLSALFKNVINEESRWVRLDSGAFARIPGGSIQQLKSALGVVDANFKLSNSVKVKLSTAQALGLSTVEDAQFQLKVDDRLGKLRDRLKEFKEAGLIEVSRHFKGKLRSYQREALSWLDFLYEFELGGILADEMGLGKTVQTLAFLQYLKDTNSERKHLRKPVLIVAPTSVMTNWLYEAKRFTPKLKTILLHGPGRKQYFSSLLEYDIIITSYSLLRHDKNELSSVPFSYLILDEAQNIKNPQAATTKAAKGLRARRRLALTGTPTENRPMELWSIMDFLMPGYLGTVDFFRTSIERPILEGGADVKVGKFLRSKTKPFILRRTKAEVEKDLPPKIESVVHVEMTQSQRELYNQILEEVRPSVLDAVEERGVQGASISILSALLRLRQVCNHPNSIASLRSVEGYDSGKFSLLQDLVIEALENGRKILLFSQFRDMLAIIRNWLDQLSYGYLYLDGETKDRQSLIDRFNSDESIRLFLISLKAGGAGLNLTGADTVIIYDPWWNPAVEGQAVDRAHRIGQTKTVNVYRLVTEHSVEQKIMELKARKSHLVDALINENGLSTLRLSKDDLGALFSPS